MYPVLIALTILSLISCSKTSLTKQSKMIPSSIINGKAVESSDSINASVVGVYNIKEQSICTGSLITPNIVMTAAHCIPNNTQQIKIVFSTNIDDTITIREPDVLQEFVLPAIQFKVGPTWNPKDETTEIDTGDIALIKFKGTAPTGYKPAVFLKSSTDLKPGLLVTLAGYGVSTVDTEEIDPKKFRNIEQAIEYGDVFCSGSHRGNYGTCFKVERSGDGLLRFTTAPISFIYQTEVRLNEKNAGTCNGDSGGPAYILQDGVYYLFGITSRGSELCNEAGIYTNALSYKNWIDDSIKILSK